MKCSQCGAKTQGWLNGRPTCIPCTNKILYGAADRHRPKCPHGNKWKTTCDECLNTEYKAKRRAYQQTPEYKAKMRAWYNAHKQTPEYKAKRRAWYNAHKQTPEYKAKRRAYQQTPEYKAKMRAWYNAHKQTPEYKAYQRRYRKEHRPAFMLTRRKTYRFPARIRR